MEIRKPNRVTRSYVQRLSGSPERVFPLLCPVREAEWIEGWDPRFVIAVSAAAEPDCVFVTPGEPSDTIWYVTRHEPGEGFVEMLKITPGFTACKLSIRLVAASCGCEATVTYTHTSLGPAGDAFVASFTEAFYEDFMRTWETRLDHYLRAGTMLHAR